MKIDQFIWMVQPKFDFFSIFLLSLHDWETDFFSLNLHGLDLKIKDHSGHFLQPSKIFLDTLLPPCEIRQ
jgi:hypothetical protein